MDEESKLTMDYTHYSRFAAEEIARRMIKRDVVPLTKD
jgi:hypothetical protein